MTYFGRRFRDGSEVPVDLVAPLACPACGEIWLAELEKVADAFALQLPLPCPTCDSQFGVSNMAALTFVSSSEWEAWDDSDPAATPPERFEVGTLFMGETS